MNYFICKKGVDCDNDYITDPRDNIFVKRKFVITNKGIFVMKSIRKDD